MENTSEYKQWKRGVKSKSKLIMEQNHIGSGNNIAGNKIGIQINMGDNGVYNETVINDINQIKTAVIEWWENVIQTELLVLIICERQKHIVQVEELASIIEYYGNECEEWKPFKEKTIIELIKEFKNRVTYKVKCFIFNEIQIDDLNFWVNWEDNHLHKIIVITDGLVLTEDNIPISSSIDHRNRIGGIIVPLHENIEPRIKNYIRCNFKEKYPRMCVRSSGDLGIAYPNIEIDVHTETKFITTLQNLARLTGIISNPKGLFSDDIRNRNNLNSLTPDGN